MNPHWVPILCYHRVCPESDFGKIRSLCIKPQDFERSEQIVLIGKVQGDEFHASDILMKCPSKYNDGKPQASK